MGHRNQTRFLRVFEVVVTAFDAYQLPAILFQHPD
jgi:hypothetical protein